MKRFLLFIILSLCFCGCSAEKVINQEYIKSLVKNQEYVILDVRTNDEFKISHIENAINIPYDEINEDIEIEKEKIVFVYCRSGNRSNIAYNNLVKLGYSVYDLGAMTNIKLPIE